MNFLNNFEKYEHPMFGYVRLPEIKITNEERHAVHAPENCSNYEFLHCLALKGYKDKKHLFQKEKFKDYAARAKRELDLFEKLGFVDYVLLVWKITSWCDSEGIARGLGRGSCGGSLIFYLIGVIGVEPIKYDLFFERFMSEVRAKKKVIDGITYIDGGLAPDVDLDIEQSKRGLVVDYLKSLYPNKVSKIATLSTLSGKVLIKECGKLICEYSEETMKAVADLIPKKFGKVSELSEAYAEVPRFKDWCDINQRAYLTALNLQDLIKNKGSHPSGYVVAFEEIDKFLPTELASGEEGKEITASFTMEHVAYLTIKLDLLGVRCCSVIADVLKATGIKVEDINLDSDPIIYDNLQNLTTPHGIFQIEAPTNLQVCQKIKPKKLSELSDVLAIARPGALSFLDKYVKNDGEKFHPLFDKILESTRGSCLYQESSMSLAHAIGFTLDEAETLRRIIGKKKVEQMVEWEQKVKDKVKENHLPEELGTMLWKILDDSASYSFNKCIWEEELVEIENDDEKPLKSVKIGDKVKALKKNGDSHYVEVLDVMVNIRECYEIVTSNGKKIITSLQHEFVCADGEKRRLKEILDKGLSIITE